MGLEIIIVSAGSCHAKCHKCHCSPDTAFYSDLHSLTNQKIAFSTKCTCFQVAWISPALADHQGVNF